MQSTNSWIKDMLVSETSTWGCLYTGTKIVLRKKPKKTGKEQFSLHSMFA